MWSLVERFFVLFFLLFGIRLFIHVLWERRLSHVWAKREQLKIVNPGGLLSGTFEVLSQSRVIANRPWVGLAHFPLFYGFVAFGGKSIVHLLEGLGLRVPVPEWYGLSLDAIALVILGSLGFLALRRFFVDRHKLTHMFESGMVLLLIGLLMVTHLLEHPLGTIADGGIWAHVNWWVHFLDLCFFPALIAYGKHLHLMVGPINVVLRHMTELPSDRPVFGADFDMSDEEKFEEEYARVGMPNGVSDFSFHSLLDPAACIECGRCNDACPSGPELLPRDHFVLSMRDISVDAAGLAALIPPEVLATCTQCRACDTVCPVGNRPSMSGLEIRGRMAFEGLYPPRALKDGAKTVPSTGNIFGEAPATRAAFIKENNFPIYDRAVHEVLLVLGCQGGNSPEVQPVVVATAKLLDAAGVAWGVLKEESCWGEALLQSSGLMEEWPAHYPEQVENLDTALGGDRGRTILTVCPHCRDTLATQYAAIGADYTDVRMHVPFLLDLIREGRLDIAARPETMAIHHPCKVIHLGEVDATDALLELAGVTGWTAGNSPAIPRCCGGGGGGFLWDSPAKVNIKRFGQLQSTGLETIVTSCPGCHRMLAASRDEKTRITDVANLLADRLRVSTPSE